MALSEFQTGVVLKAFVAEFEAADSDEKRRKIYNDLYLAFRGDIDNFESSVHEVFEKYGSSGDIVGELDTVIEERSRKSNECNCEICEIKLEDEDEVVKILSRELSLFPRLTKCEDVGTVMDFAKTGFSFVAKVGGEVVGVVLT